MAALLFDDAAHRYTIDGAMVPSVTQVLKPLYDFSMVRAELLAAKAALGTAIHRACELLDNDDLDEESDAGRAALAPLAGYLAAYKTFLADEKPEILHNEQRMYHPVHRYAGTTDRRYLIGGQVWDVDLKSTVSMSPVVGIQVAAYSELFKANGDTARARRGALQLFPNGKYYFNEFKDPGDFAVFLSLLTVQRFKERHSL
jgi:hypothetical protein